MRNKEKWSKPKLIILERTNPEEMVLQICKWPNPTGGMRLFKNEYCSKNPCNQNLVS